MPLVLRKKSAVLVAIAVVLGWQALVFSNYHEVDARYRNSAAQGLCIGKVQPFLYFLYYFGAYPVATPERLEYSREGADRLVREKGQTLVNDFNDSCAIARSGEGAKVFLLLPSAWWKGSAKNASLRPVAATLFVGSLMATLWAFASIGRLWLGIALVLLLGSNPFLIVESYGRENVFSFAVTLAILALAMNLGFLARAEGPPVRVRSGQLAIALATGALLGMFREVRSESALALLGVIAAYLTCRSVRWTGRLLLAGALLASFVSVMAGWRAYLDWHWSNAQRFVERHGGTAIPIDRPAYHPLIHPLFCGLGDFGESRGYSWEDRKAFAFAAERIREKYGKELPYSGDFYYDVHIDPRKRYKLLPDSVPEYSVVLREKIMSDITEAPGWFFGVLARRLVRIFSDAVPVTLSLGFVSASLPGGAWVCLPILAWLAWRRRFFELKLMAFTLPLAAVALAIHSGGGLTYYNVFHLVAFATVLEAALLAARRRVSRLRGQAAGSLRR